MNKLTGKVFGKWTVGERVENSPAGQPRWLCRCSCGVERPVLGCSLVQGLSLTCGCSRSGRGRLDHPNRTHGLCGTPIHRTWLSMLDRCRNPNNKRFGDYGGRGIRVCLRWRKFENFLADMGQRPEGKILDRKNTNGNYTPSNCRWVNLKISAQNRRNSRMIQFRGEKHCLTEWAELIGISQRTLFSRFRYGWSVKDALSRDVRGASVSLRS